MMLYYLYKEEDGIWESNQPRESDSICRCYKLGKLDLLFIVNDG
jgi:hypothetical protein